MLRKGRWLPSPAMVTTPAVVVLERGACNRFEFVGSFFCRNTSVPANLWGSWASWGSNGWTYGQNKQSTVHFSAQGCGYVDVHAKKPEFKATSLRWILVDQGTLIWMETNGNQLVFSHACFICKIPSYTHWTGKQTILTASVIATMCTRIKIGHQYSEILELTHQKYTCLIYIVSL